MYFLSPLLLAARFLQLFLLFPKMTQLEQKLIVAKGKEELLQQTSCFEQITI